MTNTAEQDSGPLDDEQVATEVGARIHQLMWRKRISQARLGEEIGVTQGTAGRKVRGLVAITVPELMKIARLLEVEPADLLPDVEPAGSTDPGVTHPYVYAVATAEITAYADVIDLAQWRSRRAS